MREMLKLQFVIVFYLLALLSVKAQDCDPVELAKIPGTWRAGQNPAIHNVTASDLAKEREVLAKIHESVKAKYSPIGGIISHSYVYSVPVLEGKNWASNPYSYNFKFLEYICERNPNAGRTYNPNLESSSSIRISINQLSGGQELGGAFNLYPADLPDDHFNGYFILEKWPEQENDRLFWELTIPSERYPLGEKVYILTYPGKNPIVPFTKGEYLKLKIPLLKKSYDETLGYHKEIDPEFDAASKRVFEQSLENLKAKEELIKSTEELLASMTPEELAEPAIIEAGEPNGEFRGFKSATDSWIFHLVKPNLAYFDPKLPKWVPQLITVNIKYDISEQINYENIQMMEKAIDYEFLKSLLGKTQIP